MILKMVRFHNLPHFDAAQNKRLVALKMGDTVLIRNCPPVSARKRFQLEKIIKSPETEWEQAHAGANAGAQGGDGQAQGPLDVSAQGQGGVLEELRRAGQTSPSKMAQGGMAGVLGSGSAPLPPS
jgi:hypothetical protein